MQNSGASRREKADAYLAVIARSAATKQSSFLFLGAKAGLLRFARNDDVKAVVAVRKWNPTQTSSRRTPGPIRRVACFARRCSPAFAQQHRPVVMGPGVRRDDERARLAPRHLPNIQNRIRKTLPILLRRVLAHTLQPA